MTERCAGTGLVQIAGLGDISQGVTTRLISSDSNSIIATMNTTEVRAWILSIEDRAKLIKGAFEGESDKCVRGLRNDDKTLDREERHLFTVFEIPCRSCTPYSRR